MLVFLSFVSGLLVGAAIMASRTFQLRIKDVATPLHGEGCHKSPNECKTWVHGCHCTVALLNDYIEGAPEHERRIGNVNPSTRFNQE